MSIMRRRATMGCLSIAVLLTTGLAGGCGSDSGSGPGDGDMPPVTSSHTSGTHVTRAVALPTGEKATSHIWVEKRSPKQVDVGVPFTYEIHVRNLTELAMQDVTVVENLPNGFELSETSPRASLSGNVATWQVGYLGPKQTETLKVRGKASGTGMLKGCSQVTYTPTGLCMTTTAVKADLGIDKTAPERVVLCDPIVYKIRVFNNGTGTAENVTVRDQLPAGLETLKGVENVMWDVGDLGPGQSKDLTVRVRARKTGQYASKAVATSANGLRAASAAPVTQVRNPILTLNKTAPDARYVGRNVTFSITVRNQGDAPAEDVVLQDAVPDNAEFVSASSGGKVSGKTVSWNLGTIRPDGMSKVSMTVKPKKIGDLRSVASASAYCTRTTGAATTRIEGIPAILLEVVDIEDPVEVGTNTTYAVTVTNQGSADGTGIRIVCVLPGEMDFVSADGPTDHDVRGKTVTFDPLGKLAPKDRSTYRITVKGVRPGDVRFQTTMTADQITKPVMETEATRVYE